LVKSGSVWLRLLLAACIGIGSAGVPVYAESPASSGSELRIEDRFESESGLWSMLGASTLANGSMRLTSSLQDQVGTIWLRQNIAPPYDVSFQFRITEPSSYGTADGIVFMFNKEKNEFPVKGGGMGFEVGSGYGVEFDTWANYEHAEYSPNVSLFHNTPVHCCDPEQSSPRLAYVDQAYIALDQWHDVTIQVRNDGVKVVWNGNPVIDYSGQLDGRFSGIGFSASTGDAVSTQEIDNVTISRPFHASSSVGELLASADSPYGSYDWIVPSGATELPLRLVVADRRSQLTVSGAAYTVTNSTYSDTGPLIQDMIIHLPESEPGASLLITAASDDGFGEDTYTFTIRRAPAVQPIGYALLRGDGRTIELYSKKALHTDTGPIPLESIKLNGLQTTVETVSFGEGPGEVHHVFVTLAQPVAAGSPFTVSILPGALEDAEENQVIQLDIPVIQENGLRAAYEDDDGIHIDDLIGTITSGYPDVNGLPGFDRYDVLMLLRLVLPPASTD